jgi:hypothetical protein
MGADKNSSLKSRIQLCPKLTTKDSHTSLPRSCCHNGPTNPRSNSQHNQKRKHNSRGKGLSQLCQPWTDRPYRGRRLFVGYSGPSVKLGRTVRIKHQNHQKHTSQYDPSNQTSLTIRQPHRLSGTPPRISQTAARFETRFGGDVKHP